MIIELINKGVIIDFIYLVIVLQDNVVIKKDNLLRFYQYVIMLSVVVYFNYVSQKTNIFVFCQYFSKVKVKGCMYVI